MIFAWCGKILHVDLDRETVSTLELPVSELKEVIGGRGLAMHLHHKFSGEVESPEDPRNAFVLATAPLTGTLLPNGGHYCVVTRACGKPRLSCATIGGEWGPQLKYAGFDAVVIQGRADHPLYLWIHDGVAELRHATHVWGANVSATVHQLLEETDKKAHVCCIGPAGENLLDAAALVGDAKFAAGVPGLAAVAGGKNLKALVVHGTLGIRLANIKQFLAETIALRERSRSVTLRGTGEHLQGPVLKVTAIAADPTAVTGDGVRPHGCFGCTSCVSSFLEEPEEEKEIRFAGDNIPQLNEARLRELKAFVDLGLDYVSAKAQLAKVEKNTEESDVQLAGRMAHGALKVPPRPSPIHVLCSASPCFVGGYALQPAIATAGLGKEEGADAALLIAARAAGCCPFSSVLMSAENIANLLTSATGVPYAPEDILRAGRQLATAGN